MIKNNCLYEDQRLSKLRVIPCQSIRINLDLIREYNKNNQEGLSELREYIAFIESYLSNPVIAWDNTGERCYRTRTGALHMVDETLGIDVLYRIHVDKYTGSNYVYILKMDYQLDRFGLKRPPGLKENRLEQPLVEIYLHNLIKESLRTALREHWNREKKRNRYSSYLYL